jgi:hypothetical protein
MTGAGDDDLLADQGRRVWRLPPAVAGLMGLTAVGLLGVTISSALVRGVMAASTASGRRLKASW